MIQAAKDDLLMLLRPIQNKLMLHLLLFWISLSIGTGLLVDILLLLLSRFIAIPNYRIALVVILFLSLVVGVLIGIWKRPNLLAAAKKADQVGLNERVVTAYDHRNHQSFIAQAQREDALFYLRRKLPMILETIKIWPLRKKQMVIFVSFAVAFTTLLFIPNPMDEVLAVRALQKQLTIEAEEKIEKAKEEVKENNNLTEDEKEELVDTLDQLQAQLKEVNKIEEKQIALDKAENELEKLQELVKERANALAALETSMLEEETTKSLMKALKKQNQEALDVAKNNLQKALDRLSEEEKEQLSQLLKNQAEALKKRAEELEDQELANVADQLNQAATEIQEGNIEKTLERMQQGLQAAANLANTSNTLAAQLRNTLAGVNQSQASLAKASSTSLASGATGNQASGSTGTGNPSDGSGNTDANNTGGEGSGANTGANGGSGSDGSDGGDGSDGSGNGSGSGNGGSGSGNGSGSGSGSGAGGNGSGSGGTGAGTGTGNHELVTIPSERIKSDGITDTVSGPLGDGESETRETQNNQATTGIPLPYQQVYQQYEEFARKSIQQNAIPSDYQEYVKEYFSHIEP